MAGKKAGKKAKWSAGDDRILVEVLKEQRAGGFQTDNGGFHNDAYKAAASRLASSTSEGGAKISESCKTRWNTMKQEFKEVQSIREKSGFGWDDERNMATAPANVWEDLVKAKPKLKKWQRKSFPLYDNVLDILEGQVATGATAFFPGIPGAADHIEGDKDDDDNDEEEEEEEEESQASTVAIATPIRRPLTSTTTANAPSSSHKRRAATPDGRPAKRAHGRKPTQSDAGFEMAEAVRDLACSAMWDGGDPSMLSPARKSRAIAQLEEDDQLSDSEMIGAFKLMRRDTSVADTYLAIRHVHRRTHFIQSELSSGL